MNATSHTRPISSVAATPDGRPPPADGNQCMTSVIDQRTLASLSREHVVSYADIVTAARIGMIFSSAWIVLIGLSVLSFLSGGPDPDTIVGVLAAVAGFVVVYLWYWLRIAWGSRDERVGLLAYAALMLLGTPPAFATPAATGFIYVYIYPAVVAGSILRPWLVVPTVLLAGLLTALATLRLRAPVATAEISLQPILFGLGAVLVAKLFVTNHALRHARDEIARLAVDEERLRFARDLHDLLGHTLSLIAIKSELAGRLLPTDMAGAAREIADVERVARDSLRDVREAVAGYRQPRLAAELAGARSALESAGIAVHVDEIAGALPEPVDAVLAWAVREGVTNVIRHSDATRCEIRVSRGDRDAEVEVTDDGRGADAGAIGEGLRGLAERARARGGLAESGPLPGRGFRVRISVPLAPG